MESYQQLFNLTKDLAQAISLIISQYENKEYVCLVKPITTPKHHLLSPAPKEKEIRNFKSSTTFNLIPQKTYYYFIIGESENLKILNTLTFMSQTSIEEVLNRISLYYQEYDGVFNIHNLVQRVPYLATFFIWLNNWQTKTGRVSLDKEIIEESLQRVLNVERKLSPSLKLKKIN